MAGASFARRRRRWASGAYPARRKTNSGAMINLRVGSAIPAGCVRTRLFAIGALRPALATFPVGTWIAKFITAMRARRDSVPEP